jgi:hypothetical protein
MSTARAVSTQIFSDISAAYRPRARCGLDRLSSRQEHLRDAQRKECLGCSSDEFAESPAWANVNCYSGEAAVMWRS